MSTLKRSALLKTCLNKKEKLETNLIPKNPSGFTSSELNTPTDSLGSESFIKLLSFNVAGLRSVLKTEYKLLELKTLIREVDPVIFTLQEHKLQQNDVNEISYQLREIFPLYSSFWSCSTVKKGYSGVAVFIKDCILDETLVNNITKKEQKTTLSAFVITNTQKEISPKENAFGSIKALKVTYPNISGAEQEGRIITIEFDTLFLVCVYVPNSGANLVRLSYRLSTWDTSLIELLKGYEKTKPVVLIGDLNVAHLDKDMYNAGAKHLLKSAGCTPQERESFSNILSNGFVDTFRLLYPEAKGHFTYWSQRARNRPLNQGLRLDYAVISESLVDRVFDSRILMNGTNSVSDHCPILLILQSLNTLAQHSS